MKFIYLVVLLFMATVIAMHFYPQINFRPMPEGLCKAKLNVNKPNWVSSLVDASDSHYIEPFKKPDLKHLAQCLDKKFENVTISQANTKKIVAYRQSRVFNFVDWICIDANGDVTSSATMGYSDLNKNRELVEAIRSLCFE